MASDAENEDVSTGAKNQIWFKVDNKTGFQLEAQAEFADWGDFAESPSTISPYASGSGGYLISSRSPFTGSAGMVGYKIRNEKSETLYLRFLGSNPYLSAKDNYSTSVILHEDNNIGQEDYNWLYYREEKDHAIPWGDGTLKISSQIGQADDVTAIFVVTLEE